MPKGTRGFPRNPTSHGGALSLKRRKKARPIAVKKPMHVILRSSRARKQWSMLKRSEEVDTLVRKLARRFGVRLYKYANVGNHLHLLVQVKRRGDFQNFLRVLAQSLMFLLTGAKKGNPVGKFWDALAFSRVVEWGKDWKGMLTYLDKNLLEARGFPRDRVDSWFGLKRAALRELYGG